MRHRLWFAIILAFLVSQIAAAYPMSYEDVQTLLKKYGVFGHRLGSVQGYLIHEIIHLKHISQCAIIVKYKYKNSDEEVVVASNPCIDSFITENLDQEVLYNGHANWRWGTARYIRIVRNGGLHDWVVMKSNRGYIEPSWYP